MISSKPTILFVPGAWHLPEVFDEARASLTARGFPSAAVALPSIGAEPPTQGLADDTIAVHNEAERLCDEGKEVVVVAHSYGGLVGAGAVKGLSYAERQNAGKSGGVIMLVYIAAFVAKSGTSLLDMLGGNWLPWMKVDGDYCHAEDAADVCYNDLSVDDQKKWGSKITHTSRFVFEDPVAHEPWHDLPCMYLFCEEDQALPLAIQESMATLLGDYSEYRCPSSHSPFLSMPDKVAEASELAAKIGHEKSRQRI
ncbi:hypothetical protein N7456_001840 [Penicillium angulare]|uniref:AB hydrolase-1 domain-containing protein n=1 Tax=Penicillium angulare TaxID=116970 RepID=A0A9W9G714_9EURO|nr:hypothetical protein N7456_001840 [Penicillium angulare]